jgi:leucyl aminopeptidase
MTLTALVARADRNTIPIFPIAEARLASWRDRAESRAKAWLEASGFTAKEGEISLLADADGRLERVFLGLGSEAAGNGPLWAFAACPEGLPAGRYRIAGKLAETRASAAALGWALGAYRFTRYRKPGRVPARLVWPDHARRKSVENAARATYLVRDLINTPAGDMGPPELATEARALAREFGARVAVITGDTLLSKNYPAIHAVGRAAAKAPRLIDLRWAPRGAGRGVPRVTICGKGVCFDTGGLHLKTTAGMTMMKKDMGGGAQALGLARMIMGAGLKVQLRVLVPAVENAVAGNAYFPLDVISTRKGLTVEVGNTDAEGRLVLADALAEACREKPDLVVDFATLTGAARVALGTGLPALFCNDDQIATRLLAAGTDEADPVWRLPLWRPYRETLKSRVADINNISKGSYGGAITAALFLEEFVAPGIPWIHLDFMGWNTTSRAGRPEGGEAQGMRAVFRLISEHFAA